MMTQGTAKGIGRRALGRRHFLRGAAAIFLGGAAVDALVLEPRLLEVSRWDVHVPALPAELEGYSIAHVTDVHLAGASSVHHALEEALAATRPDLIAITGDVVDSDTRVHEVGPFLARLRGAGSTVRATLGNWEHWGEVNLHALASAYAKAGARMLRNEHQLVERGLIVVATDDSCSGEADLPRAFSSAPGDRPCLLLSHAPGCVRGSVAAECPCRLVAEWPHAWRAGHGARDPARPPARVGVVRRRPVRDSGRAALRQPRDWHQPGPRPLLLPSRARALPPETRRCGWARASRPLIGQESVASRTRGSR
ncbi:MAG: metallophosphoesterase [Deltaproteobacteria bacterium]|nr:metallophosphoesterase [Deltaproteobacteria bacterium]